MHFFRLKGHILEDAPRQTRFLSKPSLQHPSLFCSSAVGMGGSFFVIFGLARPGAARVQGTELKDFIFEQDIRKAAPNVIMMTCFLLFRSFVCHD